MSKLSPSLKALINAPFARPGQAPAPSHIREVYQSIAKSAANKSVGLKPWLALSVRHAPLEDFFDFFDFFQALSGRLADHVI
jgi:hypothetical protein